MILYNYSGVKAFETRNGSKCKAKVMMSKDEKVQGRGQGLIKSTEESTQSKREWKSQ
jgi:hypothetical protein